MDVSDALGDVVMRSPAMRLAVELARLYSKFDRPIVFVGPVGVGKTTLARAAFQPPRLKGPFVTVSAGNLKDELSADRLFGHVAGAFTGAHKSQPGAIAMAANGALLLDDIAYMSHAIQGELLRVIDTNRYCRLGGQDEETATCRFLFATTATPAELVADGHLLRDFESRLGEFQVRVPPLCERPQDILPIARAYAEILVARYEPGADLEITADAAAILEAYEWPSNVREVRGAMDYAFAHAGVRHGTVCIRPVHLPEKVRGAPMLAGRNNVRPSAAVIEATVRATGGNKSEAARQLGVHRNTLGRRLRELR